MFGTGMKFVLSAGVISLAALCFGESNGNGMDDNRVAEIKTRLASATPFKPYCLGNVYPYETMKGVALLGRTPSRHSRDISKSALGIGFETLDRGSFDPEWTYELLGQTGVKWARCGTGWMKCEPEKGRFDFAWLDRIVDSLRAQGIEPWFQLGWGHPEYTPCAKFDAEIAQAKQTNGKVYGWARGYVGEAPWYHGEEAMAGWKRFVRALARHFKGRVRVWEVWNEPGAFWREDNKVAWRKYGVSKAARDFAAFMRETAAVVRGEIPDARMSFDLARLSSGWVPALSKARIGEFIDIYSYHGYEPYPEAALDSMFEQLRTLFRRPDGTPLEIWQGESGRSTGKANNGVILPTEYSQARFIARRVTTDIAHGAAVSSIFTASDFICYYADGRDQYYGVLNGKTRKPKHGWYTLQCLGWLLDGLERAPENFVYFSTGTNKQFIDHLPYAAVKTACFKRKGVPVFAVWQPQHVELNTPPVCGRIQFVTGENVGAFKNPVIIDPVRCEVWDISGLLNGAEAAKDNGLGIEEIKPFYALDYPLFITDLSVFNN